MEGGVQEGRGMIERIIIAHKALNKLRMLIEPSIPSYAWGDVPLYANNLYPMVKQNGDIIWGVVICGDQIVPLIEEVYQVTTA